MTSKVIIKAVADSIGKTQKETKAFFDAAEVAVKTSVKSGEKVKAMDVTFSVKDVAARTGRNPKTGETLSIPATKKVATKLSKDFKETVKD